MTEEHERRSGASHRAAGPRPGDLVEPAAGSGAAHVHAAALVDEPTDDVSTVSVWVQRAKDLAAWVKATRPMRANARFTASGGGVLTGGIAYAALFSVFAALTIGWTVFMAVLGGNDELRADVLDAIDGALPGLVKTDSGSEGLVDPSTLRLTSGLTVASIVAFVVLLVSALSATAALRTGVRAMFAEIRSGENAVLGKVRQLGGLVGMALAVLLSAVLTTGVTTTTRWVLSKLDWSGSTTNVVNAAGIVVAFLVDVGVFLLVVKVLAGLDPPWRDLLWGAAIAGVGIGVVRYLGTSVVAGGASENPILQSFAVIVTLLVWVNLISRIVLLAAAWVANPPLPED